MTFNNQFCFIDKSSINGFGLFASTLIPKGTKISFFTGEEVPYKVFSSLYKNDPLKWQYVYKRMPWQNVVSAKNNRNLITYVNDGHYMQNNPHNNCILKARWLIAIEDIKPLTELTLKYHSQYFK